MKRYVRKIGPKTWVICGIAAWLITLVTVRAQSLPGEAKTAPAAEKIAGAVNPPQSAPQAGGWSVSDCASCHDKAAGPEFQHSAHARQDQSCAKCQRRAAFENERGVRVARLVVSRIHHWGNRNENVPEHSKELCNVRSSLSLAVQWRAVPDRACTRLRGPRCERFRSCFRRKSFHAASALLPTWPPGSIRGQRNVSLRRLCGFRSRR